MKNKIITLLISGVCVLGIAGTAFASNDRDTLKASDRALTENVNLKDVANIVDTGYESGHSVDSIHRLNEETAYYLAQKTEKDFKDVEGIDSADAAVSYDRESKQFAIALSLTSDLPTDKEQVESYKYILSKTFETVTIYINGVMM